MRVLVTGSRNWDVEQTIHDDLAHAQRLYGEELVIVHGGCPTGADQIAHEWAKARGVVVEVHYPNTRGHGKRGFYLRNKAMVDAGAEVVLAYVRNASRGASMTVDLARKAGLTVVLREWWTQ